MYLTTKLTRFLIASVISASLSSSAFATETSSGGAGIPKDVAVSGKTVTTSNPPSSTGDYNPIYLNYFAIYHGASLGDLGASHTVTTTGTPSKQGIFLDSEVTAAYMINSDIGIGPDVPFLLYPSKGQGAVLGDVGIKVFDKHAVSYNGLNIYANLILQAPTNDLSIARNMSFAVKTTPSIRYVFPKSRFQIGAWTEAKDYLGVTSDKTFKLYAAPYVGYQLTSTLGLNLEYEMEAHHNVGMSGIGFANYATDVEPGFYWFVTPKIMINPYVLLYTGNRVTVDSSAIGAVISATLL